MICIRRASDSDAELLAALGKHTFIKTFAKDNRQEDVDLYLAETYSTSKQLAEIRDPKRWIEIAWQDEEAAGFLHLLKGDADPAVTGNKPIEILRLYVDSKWLGKGVGSSLMDRCIQIAREQGYETLWLGVWEKNFKAQAFYQKYKFITVGQHGFRLGTDNQLDYVMTRPVEDGLTISLIQKA